MKLSAGYFPLLVALPATSTNAFQLSVPTRYRRAPSSRTQLSLFNIDTVGPRVQKPKRASWAANMAFAGAIFTSSLITSGLVAPQAANADVELSTGAVIVQTSTRAGKSVLRTEVDAKNLFTTVFKNRKELRESFGRISDAIQAELKAPVWTELSKEVLQIEGDVAPEITVSPPRDIQQTIKDLSKGRLNFIVNGEVINVVVEDKFTQAEDEITVKIKGVKGLELPSLSETPAAQAKTRLQEQIEALDVFWETPVTLPKGVQEVLPKGTTVTIGNILLSGTVSFVGGSYAIAYSYYISQQQAAEEEAAARRKMIDERKKKSADIKKKTKGKTEESSEESDGEEEDDES